MAEQRDNQDHSIEMLNQNIPTYYANQFHIEGTQHDIRIAFGKLVGPNSPPIFNGAVYMSYSAAKQLSQILINVVNNYEEQFGPIALTPKPKK